MLAIEVILALVVIFLGIKHKKYLASVLAAIQAPFTVWFELTKRTTSRSKTMSALTDFR